MSLRWRLSLVVVVAAIVLGGFMPQSLLTGAHTVSNQMAIAPQGPPTFPSGCAGTSCSKSAPVAPTPVLTIAGLAALAAIVLKTSGAGWSRRIRTLAQRLPRGTVPVQFHPPKFSGFDLIAA